MNKALVDNQVRLKQITGWGPFFLFLLHNTEEGLYMTKFAYGNKQIFPSAIQDFLLQTGETNFRNAALISLLIATLLPFFISLYAYKKSYQGSSVIMILILYWILLVNALQHVTGSLIIHSYTPGVITALLLNIPVSTLILYNSSYLFGTKKKIHFLLFPASVVILIFALTIIWGASLVIIQLS